MKTSVVYPLFICAALALGLGPANAQETITAIKAGRLLNGTSSPAIENAVIIVKGERIEAAGSAAQVSIPKDARIVDLSHETVLPGLIDGHLHPTIRAFTGPEVSRQGSNSLIQQLNEMAEPPALQAARGVRDLRLILLSGVTTGYVVGEVEHNDIHLKYMVDSGVIPGPRLYPSGPWIIPTGGYGPIPATDGPWNMRTLIRKNVEAGAHHIKLVVGSGMATGPNAVHPLRNAGTNFSKEEIVAAVDEAHRLGVKVTAHAVDPASMRLVLESGVDSVQHAPGLTPDILDLFVRGRTSIVNTYTAFLQAYFTPQDFHFLDTKANNPEEWISHSRKLVDAVIAKNEPLDFAPGKTMQQYLQERYAELRAAKEKGIPISVGTDNMQGLLHLDIEHLVNAGFTPLEAISAATGSGAKALGIDDEVGTIAKGKYADIISVRGRPDVNIQDLAKIHFVMVGGRDFSDLSFR